MPVNATVISLLITLLLLLSPTYQQDIGDECTVKNSGSSTPGVCQLLSKCAIIQQQLLAGILPTTCGYKLFEPIVCCPSSDITMKQMPTEIHTGSNNETIGRVARAKCAEAMKAVYGFVDSAIPWIDPTPRNVSLCALKTRKLIVGGTKADPKEFPHMTAIGYDGGKSGIQWGCGGSLISEKIVLTAAHCTYALGLGAAKWARVGDLNLVKTTDDARPQTIEIIERIRHPDYKRPAEYNDIAILKLEKAVIYDAYVRPACLPVDWPNINDGTRVVAAGWGRVNWFEDAGSENLLKVVITTVSYASCNASFSDGGSTIQLPLGIMNDRQICAGEVGKDTCQGDSGGPIAVFNLHNDCVYDVVGITSIGRFCGNIIPGVYTRIYHYISWIERTAWPEYF